MESEMHVADMHFLHASENVWKELLILLVARESSPCTSVFWGVYFFETA